MKRKLNDSEQRILELLWDRGPLPAGQLARLLGEQVGWSKTTTYTLLGRCVDKGILERRDPGFLCSPLVTRREVQAAETQALIDKLYGGAADRLVASLLEQRALSLEEIARLKQLVAELK